MSEFEIVKLAHEASEIRDEVALLPSYQRHTVKSVELDGNHSAVACICGHVSESADIKQSVLAHENHVRDALSLQLGNRIRKLRQTYRDAQAIRKAIDRVLLSFVEEFGFDRGSTLRTLLGSAYPGED
jgi:hypothetical protein